MLLTTDLSAVAANWRQMSQRMGTAEAAGVVKANAYGLGAQTVGRTLAAAGCRTFFVATPDEGVALRAALPQAEIYVLSGPVGGQAAGLAPFVQHNLRPVLNSSGQVALWRAHAASDAPFGLQVETGMNRLGLPEDEARAAAQALKPAVLISHRMPSKRAALPPLRHSIRRPVGRWPTRRGSFWARTGILTSPGLGLRFMAAIRCPIWITRCSRL
jgi:alanine racemase